MKDALIVLEGRVDDLFSVEEDSLLHCLRVNRTWLVETALYMRDYFLGEVPESDIYDELLNCYMQTSGYSKETHEILYSDGEINSLLQLVVKVNDFFHPHLRHVEGQIPDDLYYRTRLVNQTPLDESIVLRMLVDC